MGCDIHLYIDLETHDGTVVNLSGHQIDLARPYGLFAAMAGVRAIPDHDPLIPPRGLPKRVSRFVWKEFFVPVGDLERGVSHSEAVHGINKHNLEWLYPPDDLRFVQNSSWHSASYLTHEEVHACCRHSNYDISDAGDCINDWLEIMRVLDNGFGVGSTRMVFWFDN